MLLFQRMLLLWSDVLVGGQLSRRPPQVSRRYCAAKLPPPSRPFVDAPYCAAEPLLCSEVTVMPIQLHNVEAWSQSMARKLAAAENRLMMRLDMRVVIRFLMFWSGQTSMGLIAEFGLETTFTAGCKLSCSIGLGLYARLLQNKSSNNKYVGLTMNELICQWSEYWPMNAFIGQYLFIDERTTLIGQCSSLANQRAHVLVNWIKKWFQALKGVSLPVARPSCTFIVKCVISHVRESWIGCPPALRILQGWLHIIVCKPLERSWW